MKVTKYCAGGYIVEAAAIVNGKLSIRKWEVTRQPELGAYQWLAYDVNDPDTTFDPMPTLRSIVEALQDSENAAITATH